MPALDGKLTPEERDRVASFLREKWPTLRCSVCATDKWDLDATMAKLPIWHPTISLGGPVYPAVVMICTSCGHMVLFNAVRVGIVFTEEVKQSETKSVHGGSSSV